MPAEDAIKAEVDAICTGEGELAFEEWLDAGVAIPMCAPIPAESPIAWLMRRLTLPLPSGNGWMVSNW